MAEYLYRSKDAEVSPRDPHLGLLFERFPLLLSRRGPRYDIAKGDRLKWLERFVRYSDKAGGTLRHYHTRMDATVQALRGERRVFVTARPLAIGLGNPNAGDIGFSLDHATGMPLIPGSSIKGLALAGARMLGDEHVASRLLGTGPEPGKPGTASSGVIAFLDALPASASGGLFEIDIITCHHDLETLCRQKTPWETNAPNPVHFIVVKRGVNFIVRLLPLVGATPADLATVWRWLTQAMTDLGIGGKTAVGYGELLPVEEPPPTGGTSTLDRARQLVREVKKETAGNLVPKILELIEGSSEASTVVNDVIDKLGNRWVKKKKRARKKWAIDLLAAQSEQ